MMMMIVVKKEEEESQISTVIMRTRNGEWSHYGPIVLYGSVGI